MGCVASKKTISVTPAIGSSGILRDCQVSEVSSSCCSSQTRTSVTTNRSVKKDSDRDRTESTAEKGIIGISQRSFRLRNIHKYLEGEQVAAGWPPWLSAVAGEAIQGWVPLKADSFEKLEKVGQGTYSSVFRARDLDTGKIVAMKKVRFDNFEPESVRFMAREIQILRRLNHPNIMKLEGLITSKLSCSLYLVFEYMEHDLAGLSSSPDIKFTESQVKCYMKQLLSGLQHCHSRGIIHRDIKGANLLVNDEGVLKMGDFGLANFYDSRKPKPLTSRVVTLWYRPPELLLGSTTYEFSVDLWSVGCVFGEMYHGKPILQGRTEIEQLHKIFKMCGSPSEEYWKKTKLPHATIFKPHQPYTSSLRQNLISVPENSFNLLETLLSVEPDNRGTATMALNSEYFKTEPFACEPSSLPKYAPNKEMDAKIREDSQRRKVSSKGRDHEASRRQSRLYRPAPIKQDSQAKPNGTINNNKSEAKQHMRLFSDLIPFPKRETIPIPDKDESDADNNNMQFSGPLIVSSSSGFSWAKKPKEQKSGWLHRRSNSKGNVSNNKESAKEKEKEKENEGLREKENEGLREKEKPSESARRGGGLMRWSQVGRHDSFDSFDAHSSRDDVESSKHCETSGGEQEERERMEYSGPLLLQPHRVDELLEKHERHIRQAVRKSWFRKWRRQAK